MVRSPAITIALIAIGALAACTTFSGLTADSAAVVPNPDGKAAGAQCVDDGDCASLKCTSGKCTTVAGADPENGKKDGDETDVDCGGKSAPKCEEGKSCDENDDCESASCTSGTCKAPSPDDGLKNADETDVDCGGVAAPKCALDKACEKNTDCASDACGYEKKCVEFKSCVSHFGGDTCGSGETSAADKKHESCCTVVQSQSIKVNKYQVTAGRMRAFIDRYNGNLKLWAESNPKGWNSAWNSELPGSPDEALESMGPAAKRGCRITQSGGGSRTYWTPERQYVDGNVDKQSYPQDVLDEKALNCVSWHLAQALCVFDGGRLMSNAELKSLRTNGGATRWPWGDTPSFQFKSGSNPANHTYNYQLPQSTTQDQTRFVSPPGRFPAGANQDGVQDLIGNVMPWVNDNPRRFAWTASWEDSHPPAGVSGVPETQLWPQANGSGGPDANGYWAIGFRCVFE
ncbi:MAG: SUMF1/EgtB/PvdO family nonheme iron enzyme [Labilithrix sp.]|nr:SUMF1/EgtB/PvdO family nonheme iron enzyme [Labilithrix sp.]MCW5817322.1 SUMF1/EgtB/PvdO family nonheme iron enzyme [Labilithrix sp.]